MRFRMDPLALVAAVLTLFTAVFYLWLMRQESDRPVVWFLGALLTGAAAAGWASSMAAPHRVGALVLAGMVLAIAGFLALFSIGLPILVAGALCLFSAALRKAPTSG